VKTYFGIAQDLHITHSNHANRLPNAQSDTGNHPAIQALDSVLRINILQRVANGHLRRPVGINRLALHLDADDLNRLVPGAETTTQTGCEDLLPGVELSALILPRHFADTLLRQATEPKSRAPVSHLPDRDSVDTLVDTLDALLAVDIHEGGEGAGGLDTCSGQLGLGDLHRLHASAEAHSRVCLRNTTQDASTNTGGKIIGAEGTGVVLGFGSDEEEDGTLSGGLNPRPGN
jgi:hypothetical protein